MSTLLKNPTANEFVRIINKNSMELSKKNKLTAKKVAFRVLRNAGLIDSKGRPVKFTNRGEFFGW